MREKYREPWPLLRYLTGWQIAVGAEYFMVLVLLFVPIGFDRPSSWGLSYGHGLVVIVLLLIATFGAFITCVFERSIVGFLFMLAPYVLYYYDYLPR